MFYNLVLKHSLLKEYFVKTRNLKYSSTNAIPIKVYIKVFISAPPINPEPKKSTNVYGISSRLFIKGDTIKTGTTVKHPKIKVMIISFKGSFSYLSNL